MTTATVKKIARQAERALAPVVKAETKIDRAARYQDEYLAERALDSLTAGLRRKAFATLAAVRYFGWPVEPDNVVLGRRLRIRAGWIRRRLLALEAAGLVHGHDDAYELTDLGHVAFRLMRDRGERAAA